jgi:Acyl carrier protein
MLTSDEVLAQIRETLAELFDIEPERIRPETRLYDDLEIDSIDAVDLLDRLKRRTGCKFAAEDFRTVRTVGDLVNVVVQKLVPA